MIYEPFSGQLILYSVVTLSLLAMYTDVRLRIIPNRYTLPAICLGLVLNAIAGGWQGLLFGMLGLAAGIGLLLLPFLLGGMGPGDVKFMAALGAFLGAYAILNVFLFATLIGGLMAATVALRNRRLGKTLGNLCQLVKAYILVQSLSIRIEIADKSIKIPYGVAIGAGVFCYLIFGSLV